jgi:hypothetical protein
MSDLFISFGNGLSPVDSNSTNNIDFKFYLRNDNSGWDIKINNQYTSLGVDVYYDEDEIQYNITNISVGGDCRVGLESFQFPYGGVSYPPNLLTLAMSIQKYFENNLDISK